MNISRVRFAAYVQVVKGVQSTEWSVGQLVGQWTVLEIIEDVLGRLEFLFVGTGGSSLSCLIYPPPGTALDAEASGLPVAQASSSATVKKSTKKVG